MRLRRTLLGMSQEKLGEAIGLTFQQVQKYERGANRIGASRLFELSKVLDVPVSYFFDDMASEVAGTSRGYASAGFAEDGGPAYEADPLAKRETLELVRAYYRIRNPQGAQARLRADQGPRQVRRRVEFQDPSATRTASGISA